MVYSSSTAVCSECGDVFTEGCVKIRPAVCDYCKKGNDNLYRDLSYITKLLKMQNAINNFKIKIALCSECDTVTLVPVSDNCDKCTKPFQFKIFNVEKPIKIKDLRVNE